MKTVKVKIFLPLALSLTLAILFLGAFKAISQVSLAHPPSAIQQLQTVIWGSTGVFTDSGQMLGALDSYDVALGDLDGDGDLDAFVANYSNQANKIWLNDGNGIFSDSQQNLGASYSHDIALGDVDGDGDLDAFIANGNNQPNKVWLNNGAGIFSDSGQNLGNSYSFGLALGDLDEDGDIDAFIGNTAGQANKIWLNDGTGNFSDSGQNLGNSYSNRVALEDLDGDDDLDAFIGNYNGQADKVWLNDGTGIFSDSGQNLDDSENLGLALGDLDNDGDLDAFTSSRGGANKVWFNNGVGIFSDSGQSLGNSWSYGVALGDVDQDGDLDAFICNYSGQANKVWLNNGAGIFSDSGQNLGDSESIVAQFGDLDGDSDIDIFVVNYANQANEVWINQNLVQLTISKTAPATVLVGEVVTYTITITNSGDFDAKNLVVTDTLPSGANFVQALDNGQLLGGEIIKWSIASLARKAMVQVRFVVTATETITNSEYGVTADGNVTAKGKATVTTTVHIGLPDEVTLTGLTTGRPNTTYVFSAIVSPITATQPITYVWQATEQSQKTNINGLNDVVTFTWYTTGTKTIIVTAKNAGGIVTNAHTITIGVPPTKVSISGPAEGLVQISHRFTATVNPVTATLSLPINYTWEATGLMPVTNVGGLSDAMTFIWGTPGVKNIIVTAENPGGAVSDTHSIAIYAPPTNISVSGPITGFVETGHSFTATVSPVTVTQPITYVWQIAGQPSIENTNGLSDFMSFTWDVIGAKTITVSARNIGGAITTNVIVNIIPQPPTVYLPLVLKRWPPIPYPSTLSPIANTDGDGFYTVNWPATDLAETYVLEEDDNTDFTSLVVVYNGSNRSWTVPASGKVAGTYYYRVRGRNEWAYGEYSNIESVTVLLPDAPILNPIDNADGDSSYTISWNTAARATSYTLEEDTDATFTTPTTLYNGSGLSWSVTNQPYGTYYYRIKATGPTGESQWSNIQSVTVVPPIEIVEHNGGRFVYWYREGSTWIELYCEVKNNTQQNVTDVELVLNVYDNNDTLLATDTDYSMIEVIRPGQTSPVEFYFDVPGGAETIRNGRVEITVRNNWSYTSEDTQNTFTLVSHSSFKDSNGTTHVVGEAKNIGTTTEDLQVTVWIRGRGRFQDMILVAGYDWVSDVSPDETVSFEEIFWKNFGDYYDHYELILEKD